MGCREMLFLGLWWQVSCWQQVLATLGGSGHCGLPPGLAPPASYQKLLLCVVSKRCVMKLN